MSRSHLCTILMTLFSYAYRHSTVQQCGHADTSIVALACTARLEWLWHVHRHNTLDDIADTYVVESIKRHTTLGAFAHLRHVFLDLAQRIEAATEHLVTLAAAKNAHLV